MRTSAWTTILGAVAARTALLSTAQAAPTDATIIGVVRDATSGAGVEGAIVVITGEKLQGERVRTTDASGLYRVPNLPPGTYEVSVIHKDYNQGTPPAASPGPRSSPRPRWRSAQPTSAS